MTDKSSTSPSNSEPENTLTATPTSSSPEKVLRRKLSRRKRWLFRGFATLLALLAIALCEGLLHVFGVGVDYGLVVPVPGSPERLAYRFNERVEEPFFAGRSVLGPEPRRFDLPRPEGAFRIVVLGGSTVQGFPWPSELAFPRQLELVLNAQELGVRFEVLNAGITAINSFSVAELVSQALEAQPDLIIVHTGHNDFYGPGGVASAGLGVSPGVYPWLIDLRRMRMVQQLNKWINKPKTGELMETLPATLEVPLNSETFQQAEIIYRNNLERTVRICSDAGVPVLLTTVACNLRGQSPLRSYWPPTVTDDDKRQWNTFFERGEEQRTKQEWDAALASFRQAEELYDGHALLMYRIAQCLEAVESFEESRTAFASARDLDCCRFRAPSSFQSIVRDVAKANAANGVAFVDVAAELENVSAPLAEGNDWFLEHVHYDFAGHRKLALTMAKPIVAEVLKQTWHPDRVPDDARLNERLGVVKEDDVACWSFILETLDVSPLRDTADVQLQRRWLSERIKQTFDELSPEVQVTFAGLSMQELANNRLVHLGKAYRAAGLTDRSLMMFRNHVVRQPWSPLAYRLLAEELESHGKPDKAESLRNKAVPLEP